MRSKAFEATLISPAPFDAYLNGDETALIEMETAGLGLFVEKGCASCHRGANVGGHEYYPVGLVEKPGADVLLVGDKGRFAVTETVNDEYVFCVAPPRNISVTASYFHSGKVWDLSVAFWVVWKVQFRQFWCQHFQRKLRVRLPRLCN